MKITEVGLLVTLVYASDKPSSLKQVINYLARPEKKGGLGLVLGKAENEVWHHIEKDISVWQPSEVPVKQVQLLHLSFGFREGGRRDWSMALNELEQAMAGLSSLPFARTWLYLGTISDRGKFSEQFMPLQAAQIRGTNGKPFTSILSRTESADRRLYLLSSASERQDLVYLALEKEQVRQKVSQMPLFAPYAALSRADTIAHQFYREAHTYLSDENRQTLHLATNALMTNAIEMLQQAKSSDSATLSLLNAQVASLTKMTADLHRVDHQLERLQATYDSHLQGNQELASLLAYHRQQMNNLYTEIGAEFKEVNLALQTGNRALSTLRLNYERLQAEEVQRLNQLEKARAIDAERAMKEQTEVIRQQTILLQELIQRDKERLAQETRLAVEQAELEKKRLEEEARAAKKERELKEQEIRATQEQVRRKEEQALEEFEAIEKQSLLIQQQLVALQQQTLAIKQQTLAMEQQTRLIQELFVQEVRSSKRIQSIMIILGIALLVAQMVGSDPTFIFLRGLVIIGTALLISLLVYLLGRAPQRREEEPVSQPKEVEENTESSDAPLPLPPSHESDFH